MDSKKPDIPCDFCNKIPPEHDKGTTCKYCEMHGCDNCGCSETEFELKTGICLECYQA